MWTPTTRRQHSRTVIRYPTDLTDAEWRVIAPYLPEPRATGRPRKWPMREIVNGIFYVMRAGLRPQLKPRAFGAYRAAIGRTASASKLLEPISKFPTTVDPL